MGVATWPQDNAIERARGRISSQKWHSETRRIEGYGDGGKMSVQIRHDDDCRNGHETFSIAATVTTTESKRRRDIQAGGCLHEDIAAVFPELAPLIRWHLCSTDGPMHYLANTLYLAGDRDHNGRLAGEPSSFDLVIRWDGFPIKWGGIRERAFIKWCQEAGPRVVADCEVIRIDHDDRKTFGPKFTLGGFGERWHDCPFDSEREALQFLEAARRGFTVESIPTAWSEGKARELGAARNAACWPEATDAQLCAPKEELAAMLQARLPALLAEFRRDVEACGFIWKGGAA